MKLPKRPQTDAEWIAALLLHGPNQTVYPIWWRKLSEDERFDYWPRETDCVPLKEAYRRWRIARKAWKSRKAKQPELAL